MITEDKVTEIFCVADDFCKVFDAQMAKYTFKAVGNRKYHRESRMSKAEIMVIMILFHSSGYRCLKHFYIEEVCKHMRHLFPEVVSYNRFVELEREIAIPLIVFSSRKFYLANVQVSALWTAPLCEYAKTRESIFTRPSRVSHKEENAPWAGSLDSSFI